MNWALVSLAVLAGAQVGAGALLWRRLSLPRRVAFALASILALVSAVGACAELSGFLLARAGAVPPAGYALVRLLPVALAAGGLLVAALIPWRGAWWALVLIPLLSFFLVPPGPSPQMMNEGHVEQVRIPLAALLACILGPAALAHVPAPPYRRARIAQLAAGIVAAALLLLAVPAGAGVFMLFDDRNDGPAVHEWRIEVTPEPAEAAFRVEVPSLAARAGKLGTVDRLIETLSVSEGEATFEVSRARGIVTIEGTGPVVLVAKRVFYGPVGEREAFPSAPPVDARNVGEVQARVVSAGDFSGGTGHTCWADWRGEATLAPGESKALFGPDGFGGAVCA